jgi:hypothetical protein
MQNENKVITNTELRKHVICFEVNKHHEQNGHDNDKFTYTDSIGQTSHVS